MVEMTDPLACGSGFTREAANALHGTGNAGVRGQARSHRDRAWLEADVGPVQAIQDCCLATAVIT